MRWIGTGAALVFATLLVLACERGQPGPAREHDEPEPPREQAGGCDQRALAQLAEELDAAAPERRVALVSAGLRSACAELLPETTRHALAEVASPGQVRAAQFGAVDEAFAAARRSVCPDGEALARALTGLTSKDHATAAYDACNLERYGVLERRELEPLSGVGWFTWTTHELLSSAGTPLEIARPIARAMLLFEQTQMGPVLIQTLADQVRAKVQGSPIPEGLLVSGSRSRLEFAGRLIAPLADGRLRADDVQHHLIPSLHEALREELDNIEAISGVDEDQLNQLLLLDLDAQTPFATVVDVLFTAGRAGFRRFAFIVEPSYPVKQALYVEPPSDARPGPRLTVLIAADRLIVLDSSRTDQPRELPKREPEAWDLAGLGELAEAFVAEHSTTTTAVVSAEREIPLAVLLEIYAVLLGPECDQSTGEGCRFARLMIEAGAG